MAGTNLDTTAFDIDNQDFTWDEKVQALMNAFQVSHESAEEFLHEIAASQPE